MTEKLYDGDSFLREFTANVLECEEYHDKWSVLLDKTAFFPEAGGQKSDQGSLNNSNVLDVQITDEKIYHIVDKPLGVGQTVTGVIDFARRFDFMQQHSAEHIVSGIANSLYGCENVGFHLSEDIVTLDFDKLLDEEQLSKIQAKANEKVFCNVAFNCYYPDEKALKGLSYRSKKELEGAVRIVEIEGTDMCACCAPHVKCAGQIGIIKLLSAEKLRGGIRIELKAGKRALEDYNEKHNNIRKISSLLASAQGDTALGVERLLNTLNEQKAKLNSLRLEKLKSKAESFSPKGYISVMFEDDLTVRDLQVLADTLHKAHGGIRGVLSKASDGFAFCICGGDDLDGFFIKFKTAFTVKGGGRNGMVQGTVMGEKAKLEKFFN